MFLILALVLLVAWLGGFTVMHVSSAAIHLLIILAIISVVVHFVRGRRSL
ncbi:MAG TPA: lmo0937 family membrane protein [Polyangia bacterium]|nr:lmo0937 family membrane protein [Polyangia bacterium]